MPRDLAPEMLSPSYHPVDRNDEEEDSVDDADVIHVWQHYQPCLSKPHAQAFNPQGPPKRVKEGEEKFSTHYPPQLASQAESYTSQP